jgi:hypothetical protein
VKKYKPLSILLLLFLLSACDSPVEEPPPEQPKPISAIILGGDLALQVGQILPIAFEIIPHGCTKRGSRLFICILFFYILNILLNIYFFILL